MRNKEFKLKDFSYFTEEEVALLERIINNMDCSDVLKDKGKEKLVEICATYLEKTGQPVLRAETDVHTDCFRASGTVQTRIQLQLSEYAKDALIKRFPLAGKDIKKNDDNWVLDTLVYSMEVPCRFVLSLADEIKIIDSPELSDYVASYYEKHLKPLFTTQN